MLSKNLTAFIIIAGLALFAHTNSQGENLIKNGDFSNGLQNWEITPPSSKSASILKKYDEYSQVLRLNPVDLNLGIQTPPLKIREILDPNKSYVFSYDLKYEAVKADTCACSINFYSENKKRFKQNFLFWFHKKSVKNRWKHFSREIGKNTRFEFPEKTAYVVFRFSFWSKDNKSSGKVLVDNIKLIEKSVAMDKDWPYDIVADVGDIQVRFGKRTFWNLQRIVYKKKYLGIDHGGSFYGTVLNFKGIGYIGSGHIANGEEKLKSLKLLINGKEIKIPKNHYDCGSFELQRTSNINGINVNTSTLISNGKIVENVEFWVSQKISLNFGYIFMHPWVTSFSDYAALSGKDIISKKFTGDKKYKISRRIKSSIIFNDSLQIGVLTTILKAPNNSWRIQYWDVPSRYRKFYCEIMRESIFLPKKKYLFTAVTIPFSANSQNWKKTGEEIADKF